MTTFAISSSANNEKLNNKIVELYGQENILIVNDTLQFVVSEKDVTAEDVHKKIVADRINDGDYGLYIVFSVTSYFGYQSVSVWNWLKIKGV